MIRTDIVDCYAAIYTHSIAWALHTKEKAKKCRNDQNMIGNVIDKQLQAMHQGQTNGIPQGSVLMDLIAEMVLGYADFELAARLNCRGIDDYQIIRFRDDYRIFANDMKDGEDILQCLTEVMIGLGLKLHPGKTDASSDVVRSSVKADKLRWLFRKQSAKNLQRHLLIIHDHSREYPNSGSVAAAMDAYQKCLHGIKEYDTQRARALIAITVDIAYHNPRTYRTSAAILSKLIGFLDDQPSKLEVVQKIRKKFSRIPNTGQMEIWLQRISWDLGTTQEFDEPLCKVATGDRQVKLWNSDWIASRLLRAIVDSAEIVDQEERDALPAVVQPDEVEMFKWQWEYV